MGEGKERPFSVDLPRAGEDRPAWVKVGVIAAVGFAVGVAWPRIAGVRLGPSAPGDAPSAATATTAAPRASEPTSATAPAVLATAPSAPPSASAAASSGPPNVVVSRGAIVACKTDDGEALKGQAACGHLAGIDNLVQPRIRRLKECSAAEGATGKLSIVFGVDFANNRLNVEVGKGSNVANVESIAGCVKHEFGGISLGAMDHDHPRYTVAYTATLTASDGATASNATPGASTATTATGGGTPTPVAMDAPTSSVVWEVAIVRDAPRTGQVVGRLQRGTKVRVGQGQENWYRVRYGGNYANEGWVYRGAIGR